ncbi:MAG TPA: phosphate ABC transporter permease PstA [Candidatus Syntrophoarchaeum butanivorans]|uniref:Phosphate transport system permease protein PstA n=1 Tax=Candidatus Syntropharchaeum butanivorans TaxID=1839936 RepID=A0A7C1AV92_9EURY|nr:MAG: phosphate ABC transporter permease PstA [Candidatus Syntrophoarchaeum sp. WYZ-LMO15]HDM36208.1 phosphate ABC transporter permease PstA [Candidatus Syntrophoarchaeum butanivorans]
MNDKIKERIYLGIFRLCGILSLLILVSILIFVIKLGIGVIDLNFILGMWQTQDITKGGIFPAIVGTFYLGIGVAVFSVPVGICCAIYLNEYARNTGLVRMIRLAIRNLAGVPSIVYGLFGFAVFVQFLHFGTSLLAASLTLAAMTIPWVITASEEALKGVPDGFREGAIALGATRWQAIRTNVLPSALPGMITGSIIGLARAMGETAPLIIVGATFYMRGIPDSPFDKFMALPYHVFILATQHNHPLAEQYAAGTALVLVLLIFLMALAAMIVRYNFRRKRRW